MILQNDFLKTSEITMNRELVNTYGKISRDNNPIHSSREVAQELGFKKEVAYGMLTMVVSSHIYEDFLRDSWFLRTYSMKSMKPVYVGDIVKVTTCVTKTEDDEFKILIHGKSRGVSVVRGKIVMKLANMKG